MDEEALFESTNFLILGESFNEIEAFLQEANLSADEVVSMVNDAHVGGVALLQRASAPAEITTEELNKSGELSRFLVASSATEALKHATSEGWVDVIWGAVILDNIPNFKLLEFRKVYPVYTG